MPASTTPSTPRRRDCSGVTRPARASCEASCATRPSTASTSGTPPAPILPDERPLDEPLNEAFRATTLTLGWDVDAEHILIEARAPSMEDEEAEEADAESVLELDDDDEDGPDLLRVRLTAEAARTFVERAFRVIRAGRPPCPLCGNPLDATGHICPRKNGHYVH